MEQCGRSYSLRNGGTFWFCASNKSADESGGLLYTPRHYSTTNQVAFCNKWASGWCWMLAYAGANGACRVLDCSSLPSDKAAN